MLAGLLALGAGWLTTRPPVLPPAGRNVLLVTIDTLRADAPGYAGGRAATPNLDRLAREGWSFDFAHAHSVVTLPSHASILTGLYPFAHGIRDNAGYRLPGDTPTLAAWLRGQGYATGAFVGAFPLDARFGLASGFDTYDDRYATGRRASELLMPERPAHEVVEAATRWIRGRSGRWFAWVHLYDPHAPYHPPEPFASRYRSDPYAGEIAWVDHALGPLLEAVRAASPALVVVTADHGEALGAHGEATHGLFAYEETLRVPLILAATDTDGRAGRRSFARHVDIWPTIADCLGSSPPRGLPGLSLRPGAARPKSPVPSYFEALTASLNRGWAPLTGVLLGREKYIDLPIPELYDLSGDPGEQHNRHDAGAARSRALASLLEGLRARGAAAPRVAEDAGTRGRLEALGYVAGGSAPPARVTEADDPKRLVALDQAVQRGVELFQRGDLDGARRLYADTIHRRPTMATPYLHLAYLEWESGARARAIDTLRQGLAAGATSREMESQLGIYLAEAGSPQEALGLLDAAVANDPGDLDAVNSRGIALFRAGRPVAAEQAFRSAAALDPTDAAAWQNLATLALSAGDLAAARRAFGEALARDPALPAALNGLGVVESREGHDAAAIDAWRRTVDIDPRNLDALYNLASTLVRSGRRDAARPYLQRFAATAPPALYPDDLARVKRWLGQQ